MTSSTPAASPGKRVNLNLDAGSIQILFRLPVGQGGAYVRKSIERLLLALDAMQTVPPQVPGGETSIFAIRAPQEILDAARVYIGPGKPFTTLSGLARTAIHRSANQ